MPTTVCQACASKVEDLQNFYSNCQEAQKILAIQYGCSSGGVQLEGGDLAAQTMIVSHPQDPMVQLVAKEDNMQDIVPCSTSAAILSTDKLLETAIKDTCILLSEEDSDETDSMDDGMSDEHSPGEGGKVC